MAYRIVNDEDYKVFEATDLESSAASLFVEVTIPDNTIFSVGILVGVPDTDGNTNQSYFIAFYNVGSTGSPQWDLDVRRRYATGTRSIYVSNVTYSAGNKIRFVVTDPGVAASPDLIAYINGTNTGTDSGAISGTAKGDATFSVGTPAGTFFGSDGSAPGYYHRVGCFNRVLTQTEVSNIESGAPDYPGTLSNCTVFVDFRRPGGGKLGRNPLRWADLNPLTGGSAMGGAGKTNELKNGVYSQWIRGRGLRGAAGPWMTLQEVINASSVTAPARVVASTLQTPLFSPADTGSGPPLVWTPSGSSPEFGEHTPCTIIERPNAPGYIELANVGNNGSAKRVVYGKYSTDNDFATGWTALGGEFIGLGTSGAWDDDLVADPNGAQVGSELKVLYRGSATWDDDAQVGLATATWDPGTVPTAPSFTKSGSNPVIARNAKPYLSSGVAPGGVMIDETGLVHSWIGARLTTSGFGHAYSSNWTSWTVSWEAVLGPLSPSLGVGDQTIPVPDVDVVALYYGAGYGSTEEREGSVLPWERSSPTRAGKFYYPEAGPNCAPSTALSLSSGGFTGLSTFLHAGKFRIFRQTRSGNTPTIISSVGSDLVTTQEFYVRLNTSGQLVCRWSTPTRAVTLTSSAAFDDGLVHCYAVARLDANSIYLLADDGRGGPLEIVASDTASDLGTDTTAVITAVGNRHPSYTAYGDQPFRGTIADLYLASGTPPTDLPGLQNAAFNLLKRGRTLFSGGTAVFDFPTDGTDSGDVSSVETNWQDAALVGVATDSSTGATDPVSANITIGAPNRGRKVIMHVTGEGCDTAGATLTFDGSSNGISPAVVSALTSGAFAAQYYIDDGSLPAAGTYAVTAAVVGASGTCQLTVEYEEWLQAGDPWDTDSDAGTGTSLASSIDAASPGSIVTSTLYNATDTDDATPTATGQVEITDFGTSGAAHRQVTSRLFALATETLAPGFNGITTAEQHILVSASWEPFSESSTPVFALQQPMVSTNRLY